MKKPKVLIVGPIPPPFYGVAVATKRILDSALNDEFTLLHLDTSDRRDDLNFNTLDLLNVYFAIKHILVCLLEITFKRPEIMYIPISQGAWGYLRDSVFIFLGVLGGCKIVLHLRGGYFKQFYCDSNFVMRWVIKRSVSSADRVIVLGDSLRALFSGLVDSTKIRVVPNGVRVDEFKASDSERHGSGCIKICFVSNLDRRKGFEDVMYAAKMLSNRYQIECIIAGAWQNKNDASSALGFIKGNSLESIVKFVGIVKGQDKINLFANADIFAMPTFFPYEGQPWVILEAMAAGLPVVSTNQGCIAETVIDGKTGFIIPAQNAKALADKLEILIQDVGLRRAMGEAGRERVARIFSEDNFISKLNDVFRELLISKIQTRTARENQLTSEKWILTIL